MRSRNTKFWPALLAVLALILAASLPAAAGTVTGIVHNGTNGNKIAPNVDVLLIQLMGGMQVVANTKTDAQGQFHFDNPAIGQGPMLIRAVYKNVMFHTPLTPGTSNLDVTIYEPTTSPSAIQVPLRLLVFQPNGDKLMVGEEYSIQNNSNPPAAYYKQDGNFEFTVPQGAELDQVSTFGPSGMPVRQGTIDKGKGKYAIAYAFQPGNNGVRISYILPYTGNQAAFKENSTYDAQRMLLVAPPTMQVASAGFNSAGQEQGYNVFSKDSVKVGGAIDVTVSGTAPPPADNAAASNGSPDQVNGRDSSSGSSPDSTIETAPARIGDDKWILLGGLAAIFAVGVGLLFRKPVLRAEGETESAAPVVSAAKKRKEERERERERQRELERERAAAAQAKAKTPPPPPPVPPVDVITREVHSNLDSLKDTLLRLELRRQAGTITDAEYALERGRAEQLLRDLVQG